MSEPRFFVDAACSPGAEITLHAHDAHHVRVVLRLREGDAIVAVHGGSAWNARLLADAGDSLKARIENAREERGGELPAFVSVLQAVTKGAKFDEVVEKTVELGAARIVPVRCERSYAEAGPQKLERWRRIARAAAMQSRRRHLPVVEAPLAWKEAIKLARTQPVLVAYEGQQSGSFAPAVERVRDLESFAIAVGPEGGLTKTEVDAAGDAGASFVSLGPTILRTETAAVAMLAGCAARLGWW
jgi:16S rRNA (uracil1498-N3)-methyltransferase